MSDRTSNGMSNTALKPCPHCGEPGKVFGSNCVGCSDVNGCGANIDFGHWAGQIKGRDAVEYVIDQWNKRPDETPVRYPPIWLRKEEGRFLVAIEVNGKWVDVIREFDGGGGMSHIVEPGGIESAIARTVTTGANKDV